MDDVCRICAEHKNNMISLLKDVPSDELSDEGQKYEELFDIKVLDTPNHIRICITCRNKLEDLFSFKEQAIYWNSYLKNIVISGFGEIKHDAESDDDKLVIENPLSIKLLENSDIKHDSDSMYDDVEDVDDYNKDDDNFIYDPADSSIQKDDEIQDVEIFNIEQIDYYNEKEDDNVISKSPTEIKLKCIEMKYNCVLCNRRFRNELKYRDHMKAHMNGSRRKKPTTQTKKNKNNDNEERVQTGKSKKFENSNRVSRKQECNICNKKFLAESKFNAHMNTHKGLPSYSCNVCGKGFNHATNLAYHMKHHNGVRNFICDICTKGFITNSDLLIHKRSHTNERPFVCEICGKAFRMFSHLEYHKDGHNEDKKFECDVCHKYFRSRSSLKNHKQDRHLEKRFNCETCNKPFSRRLYFKMHINRYHKELMDKLFPEETEKLRKLSTKT